MTERVGCGIPCLLWSPGVREVVGSHPGRVNSKCSFSSCKEIGKVFSSEMPFPTEVLVGKCKLQAICVFLLWGIQPR